MYFKEKVHVDYKLIPLTMKAARSDFISNFMYGFAKYTLVCILMIDTVLRLIKPRFNGKMVNNQRK